MSSGETGKQIVCVTGASGYIASWLVKYLLERGYTVKASVRDLDDPAKTEHLNQLPGADERLVLFKADLMEEGSFDAAVDGCIGVFHTASPCIFNAKDPQAEVIDPAVNGTLNVLRSCAKTLSVERVILTSSMAAVSYNRRPQTHDVVVDEMWFSDSEFCKELELWYFLSKTLAEESAWKFAKNHTLNMVTINPGMVIGPLLQPTLNESVGLILNIINGAHTYGNVSIGWVDVRDVAKAHVQAFECPLATGRYCIVEKVVDFGEIIQKLHELYPAIQLLKEWGDDKLPVTYKVSKEKAKTLGIDFIPFEISLKQTVESLKEKRFI